MAAGRIKGITIEIGGDTTKLVSALAKVDNSISKTQSNLRDLNRALKLDPGNTELLKDKHGLAIGMRSNIRYSEYEIQLQPGDAVFVYTDGVPEARNAREEFYGLKRTEETLNRCPSDTAEAVLQAIRDDNARFVGDATQFDDLTVLCLIYRGTEKA